MSGEGVLFNFSPPIGPFHVPARDERENYARRGAEHFRGREGIHAAPFTRLLRSCAGKKCHTLMLEYQSMEFSVLCTGRI